MKTALHAISAGLCALTLAACGGGGSSGTSAPTSQSTTGTMVKTTASSITVNGKTFDVSRATVRINKAPASAADLRTGMRVAVKGNGGNDASEVDSDAEVRGPVSSVSASTTPQSFMIGQTKIVVDASTVYDDLTPASFDAIKQGVVVEVDGTRNAAGDIVATRIEGKSAAAGSGGTDPASDELRGPVTAIASGGLTVGTQAITVTDTTQFAPPTTCSFTTIKVGDPVEVHGTLGTGGTFTATRIECEGADDHGGTASGDQNEVEGLVTNPDKTAKTFTVDTQAVRYTDTTRFENGTPDNLIADARVEVKGTMDGTTLVATQIVFEAKP